MWTISDVPLIDAYSVYLDNKAKNLSEEHAIYNEEMFQSRDLHYYITAHEYRFRYKASGTSSTIPEGEVNNNAMGVELFNEYDFTMTFKNDNTVAINKEIISISYLSE